MIRGLMKVTRVEPLYVGSQSHTVELRAMYEPPEERTDQQERFAKATPNADLRMTVDNPVAVEWFQERAGKYVYMDFSDVE